MTYYDWICSDCEVIWEEDHPIGKAPKQTKCPKCDELRDRNWSSVTTFKMKGDCHTNRVRMRKYHEKGLDKDSAHEFYNEAMDASKRTIATGWKHYKRMVPNVKKGIEDGIVRRRTEEEAHKVKQNAKKLTEAVYNDRGINIGDTLHKPQ